jgi:hypothetical protein
MIRSDKVSLQGKWLTSENPFAFPDRLFRDKKDSDDAYG